MATISELIVELRLSAENFNNGLKQAQREAKEFEKDIKPTLQATKDLGAAMTVAGGLVTAGFLAATKSAVDYGDKLNDARQRTGRTVEDLAKLGFAAEQSGTSFDDLSRGLAFLAKNSKATTQDLNVIADAFAKMEDGPQKAKLAFDLFGKSGQALIPLLNEGSAGIRRLGEDAQKAGLVISQDFATASDQINDTLNEMKASAMGASVGIAQALLPTLQSVASLAAEAGAKFAAFTKEHPMLVQAAAALGAALLTVGTALTAIAVVVPKVQAGFALLTAGAAALGISITAATAGIVALGAAVGVAVGMFANWAIEGTRVQKWLDSFTDGTLKKLGFEWNSTSEAQKSAEFTAKAVAKAMENKGTATKAATTATIAHTPALVKDTDALKAQQKAIEAAKDAQELATKGLRIALDMRIQEANLLPRVTKMQFDMNEALRAGGNAAVRAASDLGSWNATVQQAIGDMEQASYNANQMQKDFDSIMKTNPGVHIASGFEEANKATVKLKSSFDDVKRTAANVFQEMFRDGEISFTKLGGVLRGIFETAASEILATMTAKLITPLVDKISGALSGLLSHIPGLGSAFGGAASAAGGAASAGGGLASSAGSVAASSVTGLVTGAISAVSGVIGNFQMARLEGTMNAVEFNTRATAIQLRDTMDLILQPIKARLEDIKAELYNHKYVPDLLEAIANGGIAAGQGSSPITINVYQNPGEDGFAFASRISELVSRYVEHGGGRLIASGLKS